MMNIVIKLLNYRYMKRVKRNLEKLDFKGNIRKFPLSQIEGVSKCKYHFDDLTV